MAIYEPKELDFSKMHYTVLFQGSPGVGKTDLACTAPDPLLLNLDNGISRVKPAHRCTTSICKDFDEVKADIEAAKGKYKTIIIDTGGALVEMLKQYVVDHPRDFKGGAKATGGISLQGFGFVKQLWNDFTRELRQNFNVVYIFHESPEKNGDDGVFYQIVCEGSTRTTVYQSCDLAARLFISNGQRYLGFTPTEQYSAKACYGISGLMPVPEVPDNAHGDFLTKLFDKIQKNLEAETKALAPKQAEYKEVMEAAKRVCDEIKKPEDAAGAKEMLMHLPHALTSEAEAKNMFTKRLKELNIVFDKNAKAYRYGE